MFLEWDVVEYIEFFEFLRAILGGRTEWRNRTCACQ